jgi:Ham1 family
LAFDSRLPLVIGTHNRKKGAEIAELLAPLGIAVVTLDDVPNAIEVVEDGESFSANARLKASQQAVHLNRWVLADDSGLEVDALNGAPGVYSATRQTIAACSTNLPIRRSSGAPRTMCVISQWPIPQAASAPRATTFAMAEFASSPWAATASVMIRYSNWSNATAHLANLART